MKGKEGLKTALCMLLGSLLMAMSTKCVFDRAGMVTGGISGIAIILKHLTETFAGRALPLWLTTLVLNLPLFVIGGKVLGFRFIRKTMITTILMTLWLYILPEDLFQLQDYVLISIFGALLSGLSVGLVFMVGASTGGTDTLAAVIQHYRREISAVRLLQIVDGVIVLGAGFLFGLEKTLYALIAIYIAAKVSELLLLGSHFAKQVYIISEQIGAISDRILKELDRGLTLISSRGAYTGNEKQMGFCIVSRRQIVPLKNIVSETDPEAFLVVGDAREVLGEGWSS